jgi:endonuclease/exonuclease/phosphatase family metal-dependent hydrolase
MTRLPSPRSAAVAVACLGVALLLTACLAPSGPVDKDKAAAGDSYLFCFWNVENLFDDQLDEYARSPDKEFDAWFARDKKALHKKLDNLSSVITSLNDGKGPDILAVVEVESVRAAELLMEALNKKLDNPKLHYTHVLMEEVSAGRHIAPAIITRLSVDADRTKLLDKKRRILEGHVTANGHDLVVIASHWTSRISDDEGEARSRYAEEIYGRFRAMYEKNPAVDLVVCGDFNDTPDDDSVVNDLHGTDDRALVRAAHGEPHLLDLLAGKDREDFGTHNYRGKWFIFDHIVVSPGMLDAKGWASDPDSVKTINDRTADKKGRPEDFGRETDKIPLEARGWSDHFPVTVRLTVQGR